MSESEQAINVSEWKELHAELEEVSDKRNRLQTENNRLKALTQLTQKECDEAKNELRDMTAQRDHAKAQWEVCCEDRSRQVTALREQLRQMTAERDAVKKYNGSQFRMVQALQRDVSQLQVERDAVSEQLVQAKEVADMFEQENTSLRATVRQLRAKQVHADLPGILCAIRLAVEQARELI
jgi:chromosome segregation ATPase